MGKKLAVLCLASCLPACLLADFSYEQSTKMTGGAMMGAMRVASVFSKQLREPVQANVAIKGNRMVHSNKDRSTVIDLDSETITSIDFQKKTYSVMTFAEMAELAAHRAAMIHILPCGNPGSLEQRIASARRSGIDPARGIADLLCRDRIVRRNCRRQRSEHWHQTQAAVRSAFA